MTEVQAPPIPTVNVGLGSVRQEVKAQLETARADVRQAIVTRMRAEEVEKRVVATTKVIEKIEAADRELKKIKPTFSGFTLDGKPVGEPIFTKEQVESAKKLNEQLAKLNGALEKALTDGDFTKVMELANQ